MTRRVLSTLTVCGLALASTMAVAADEHYAAPSADKTREQALAWVAQQKVQDQAVKEQVAGLWSISEEDLSDGEVFDLVVKTFALVDADSKKLVEACSLTDAALTAPDATGIEARADEFYKNAMGLFYARHLTQRRMYDEALDQFASLDPSKSIDPATLLFHRAVCEQQLLMKSKGLKTLKQLISHTERVPVRYSSVAKLMEFELQQLKEDTLDEVARMMNDVERRLDLGRAGRKVQKREAEIIATLDYLIEKLEQCNGGCCGGECPCNKPGGKNKSSSPAADSNIKGQTAPGTATVKNEKQGAGWGRLPEKEVAQAKQYFERNFPPHYRKAMQEYFKRLAEREKK